MFKYRKNLPRELVYVALSRVKTLEGLYITTPSSDTKFHHARPVLSPSSRELRDELNRLKNHELLTMDHIVRHKMMSTSCTILSLNVQSLSAHVEDMESDEILSNHTLLCLNETWTANNTVVPMKNMTILAQNKRNGKSGGVAVYRNNNAIVTSTNVKQPELDPLDHGDLCVAQVSLNEMNTLIAAVYFNPGTTTQQILDFLTKYGHYLNSSNADKTAMPMILCGDFNCNISDAKTRTQLCTNLRESFS